MAYSLLQPDYFSIPNFTEAWNNKQYHYFFAFGSFYFWLDLMAVISLVPEIPWLNTIESSDVISVSSINIRATRVSRIGARAGRIVRIIRIARLVRIIKLYKYFSTAKQARDNKPDEALNHEDESRVGAQLSDLTTRRVIIGVLIMLLGLPLVTYQESDNSSTALINLLHSYALKNASEPALYHDATNVALTEVLIYQNLLYLKVNHTVFFDTSLKFSVRKDDIKVVSVTDNGFTTTSWFNEYLISQEQAVLSILLTLFVIVMLACGAMVFAYDANRLVLRPIEIMLKIVEAIAMNPLETAYTNVVNMRSNEAADLREGFETTMLLTTILKIGGLLKIGFGECGAIIITNNLKGSTGELDPMLPGRMVECVYGYVDMSNFIIATDLLQENVVILVNQLAAVVHSVSVRHEGGVLKNVGSGFLLVWKLRSEKEAVLVEANSKQAKVNLLFSNYDYVDKGGEDGSDKVDLDDTKCILHPADNLRFSAIAGKALVAFLRIIAEVQVMRDEIHEEFEKKAISAGQSRFATAMTFGLHWGFSVEGALGTDKKIDACYVGPAVTMASTLSKLAKIYKIPLLMSGSFYSILCPEAMEVCRFVDRVQFQSQSGASSHNRMLVTYDVDVDAEFDDSVKVETSGLNLMSPKGTKIGSGSRRSSLSKKDFNFIQMINQADSAGASHAQTKKESVLYDNSVWTSNETLIRLRRLASPAFDSHYQKGFIAYLDRRWGEAREEFTKAQDIYIKYKRANGNPVQPHPPTVRLLENIAAHNGVCPEGWSGFQTFIV